METFTLVLCILLFIISLCCLGAVALIYTRVKALSDKKGDDKKLDELKESVYNEFSRNRTEQSNMARVQREEISSQISDINKRLQSLSETNQEQLMRIWREMANGLSTIRDKNVEVNEKHSQKIEIALTRLQESN